MSNLWCVHVIGPDDLYPCATYADAEQKAKDFNERFGKLAADSGILFNAVVAPWPHDTKSHAEGAQNVE